VRDCRIRGLVSATAAAATAAGGEYRNSSQGPGLDRIRRMATHEVEGVPELFRSITGIAGPTLHESHLFQMRGDRGCTQLPSRVGHVASVQRIVR
jgi:hypothetical protein